MPKSKIEFESDALTQFIQRRMKHPPPFTPEELAHLDSLVLRDDAPGGAVNLFPNLTSLGLSFWDGVSIDKIGEHRLERMRCFRSAISDIASLTHSQSLKFLKVDRCPVSDISVVSSFRALEELEIRECLVEDVGPIVDLIENGGALRKLTLKGNPVSQKSLDALRRAVETHDVKATILSDELAEANRRLAALGVPVSAKHIWDGAVRLPDGSVSMTTIGRFKPVEMIDSATVTAGDFDRLVANSYGSAHEFWQTAIAMAKASAPPPRNTPPRFPWDDHIEDGTASDARQWIAGLEGRGKASLAKFVDRYPDATFGRYDDAYVEEMAKVSGHAPPPWLRTLVTALFYAHGWHVVDGDLEDAVSLSFGPNNEQDSYGERGLFIIGETRGNYTLCVNLENPSDRTVYRLYPGELSTFQSIASMPVGFGDYLDLFDRCDGLGSYVDGEFVVVQKAK